MASILEKIENMEKQIQQLAYSNIELSRRLMAMDQAHLSLSKTLAAVSEVLMSKDLITDKEVMNQIRDQEDSSSERQVNQLVDSGVLVVSDAITDSSIYVLAQAKEDGTPIANYYVVEMKSGMTSPELKELARGKKVGETFTWEANKGSILHCTVKHIFEAKTQSGGEDES